MKTLLIDISFLAHQAKYIHQGLSYKKIQTGVIYGVLKRLLSLGEKFETNKFVFLFDSKKSLRKHKHSFYKDRESHLTDEEKELNLCCREQIGLLRREILPEMGFRNILQQAGHEADDLMARLVKQYPDEEFVIVTADQDLYQCIGPNAVFYNPSKKEIIDTEAFKAKYNLDPDNWRWVKALGGCSSDTVPGIKGIGEKTAIKYLNKELKEGLKAYESIVSVEGQAIVDRNYWLVSLPLPTTKDLPLCDEKLSVRGFIHVAREYGIRSYERMKEDFRTIINIETKNMKLF